MPGRQNPGRGCAPGLVERRLPAVPGLPPVEDLVGLDLLAELPGGYRLDDLARALPVKVPVAGIAELVRVEEALLEGPGRVRRRPPAEKVDVSGLRVPPEDHHRLEGPLVPGI